MGLLREANFFSRSSFEAAPGIRLPSTKKIAGVPVIPNFFASAKFLSRGFGQSVLLGSGVWVVIQLTHVFDGSLAHQTAFDLVDESAERIGIKKVYTVILSIVRNDFSSVLQ